MRISMIFFLLAAALAQADPSTGLASPAETAAGRPIAPAKLEIIRGIGRNILLAKKPLTESSVDTDQVGQLRAAVDKLIALQPPLAGTVAIRLQGQGGTPSTAQPQDNGGALASARTEALELAGRIHPRGNAAPSQSQGLGRAERYSAGLPVGSQRAKLFERWAGQLDAALAEDGVGRTARLLALRDRLQAHTSQVADAAPRPGTPTLQAMPWDGGAASGKAKTPRRNRRKEP